MLGGMWANDYWKHVIIETSAWFKFLIETVLSKTVHIFYNLCLSSAILIKNLYI